MHALLPCYFSLMTGSRDANNRARTIDLRNFNGRKLQGPCPMKLLSITLFWLGYLMVHAHCSQYWLSQLHKQRLVDREALNTPFRWVGRPIKCYCLIGWGSIGQVFNYNVCRLVAGFATSIALILVEMTTFMFGLTMFSPTVCLICILFTTLLSPLECNLSM